MGKSISITVYPSALGAEYLTVSDAMRQVLDFIDALGRIEATDSGLRQIVWRLTEAHTNSPPFTVTAEAYSIDPLISIDLQATRVSTMFADGLETLLGGMTVPWLDEEIAQSLEKIFLRNQNGIGKTEFFTEGRQTLTVKPENAQIGIHTIGKYIYNDEEDTAHSNGIEYGSAEVEVVGIVRWNDKPALSVIDRLGGERATCVLSTGLAEKLGPTHSWHDAWDGRRLLVFGALHYGREGRLRRIDAEDAEEMPWTDVPISDLRNIDILQGRSVGEHLDILRSQDLG